MDYNKFSNYFGTVAKYKFPKKIQHFINWCYVKKFKIDLSEFKSVAEYDSLNALFTRALVSKRQMDDEFISPSDGLILQCDKGEKLTAYSIKNHYYDVSELLGNSLKFAELQEPFDYLNIYLSPKDYHHYHAPEDLEIMSLSYFPGELFSVAKKWLQKIENLYPQNERAILKAKLPNQKLIWIVFVGAWNVGKIKFSFEKRLQTNAKNGAASYEYENLIIKKGEHLGNFELGSTIVIISQNGGVKFNVKSGDVVKFGDKIGQII